MHHEGKHHASIQTRYPYLADQSGRSQNLILVADAVFPLSPCDLPIPLALDSGILPSISAASTMPPQMVALSLCFTPTPLPLKRPRTSSKIPPVAPRCSLRSHPLTASTLLSVILFSSPVSAKTVLSTNTILRRYVATDSAAILRYALPLPSERLPGAPPPPIRRAQELLERLGVDIRARGAAGLIGGRKDLAKLNTLLLNERLDVLLDVPARKRGEAAELMSKLERRVGEIQQELGVSVSGTGGGIFPPQLVAVGDALQEVMERRNSMSRRSNFDGALVESLRQEALNCIASIEQLAVEGLGLPYRIPRRYNAFPRLVGRATVEIDLVKGGDRAWMDSDFKPVGKQVNLKAILDGYSAPLTTGNFVDLVHRGYYNNTPVLAIQKAFFAQLGERQDDDVEGFRDPKTGVRRQIPMEILVDGDPAPSYGGTLDELGVGDLQPALPITAYGAMAMVHSVEDANDASTQFYVFLLDPTSYQARSFGGTVLTGSISTFGYISEGREFLQQLEAGDKVSRIKVIAGEENFRENGDI